ncbi:MAG: hypothetical protein AAGH46_00375 [Bacteroidota bacterium]
MEGFNYTIAISLFCALMVLLFILFRQALKWIWKVNEISTKQDKIVSLLKEIQESIRNSNGFKRF